MSKKTEQIKVEPTPTNGAEPEGASRHQAKLTSPTERKDLAAARELAVDVATLMRRQLACLSDASYTFDLAAREGAILFDGEGFAFLLDAIAEYTRTELHRLLTSVLSEREAMDELGCEMPIMLYKRAKPEEA